jgi:hypothetical protein
MSSAANRSPGCDGHERQPENGLTKYVYLFPERSLQTPHFIRLGPSGRPDNPE